MSATLSEYAVQQRLRPPDGSDLSTGIGRCQAQARTLVIAAYAISEGHRVELASEPGRALPGPYEGGGRYGGFDESKPRAGLPGLSGLRCRDATPILRAGIETMQAEEDAMRAMEPSNGWGSYEGALAYLSRVAAACAEHPDGVLAVNW